MNQDHFDFIKTIINQRLDPNKHKAFIFGSRANNTHSQFSDYDIGIEGEKLSSEVYFDLIDAFENSDFPFMIDLVEFNQVSHNFKNIAQKNIIPINY